MQNPRLPKVVVIGGSIAGLSTGIALRCVGCDVQIYEQSPTTLRGRGGGLVVQYEMLDWMAAHGIAALATLSIPGVERQFFDREGRGTTPFPTLTHSRLAMLFFISYALPFPTTPTTTVISASVYRPRRRVLWSNSQ